MKVHTTNYYNTFIEISEDSEADKGLIPSLKGVDKTIAGWQYDILINHPYKYTSDEILFQVLILKKGIEENEISTMRTSFFSKGQPCLRTSPLAKKWGWGIHHNAEGKVAIFGVESKEYDAIMQDEAIKKVKGMRSKRK